MQQETQTAMVDLNLKKIREGDTATRVLGLKTISFLLSGSKNVPPPIVTAALSHIDKPLICNESQLSIVATTLLEQMFQYCSQENHRAMIRQKLLRLVVRNLGDEGMQLRKLSHRCLLEYVRRFGDFDSIFVNYLTEGLQNWGVSAQLKQKCINSLQSILILEFRFVDMKSPKTKLILEVLIDIGVTHQNRDVKRASVHCIITISKISGFKALLKSLSKEHSRKLQELQNDCQQLYQILSEQPRLPVEGQTQKKQDYGDHPRFGDPPIHQPKKNIKSLLNDYNVHHKAPRKSQDKKQLSRSIRMFSGDQEDITEAEEILKQIQSVGEDPMALSQIQAYLPTLQVNLKDKRVQLFNISVRTIQSVLQIRVAESRFYVRVVPFVVERMNDQKFTVRNTIIKLIRQYLLNYTALWIRSLIDWLKSSSNFTYKEDIINMMIHGYQSTKVIEFDYRVALAALAHEAQQKRKSLKNKALHCMVLILNQRKTSNADPGTSDYELIQNTIPEEVGIQLMMLVGDHKRSKNKRSIESGVILEDPLQYTLNSKKRAFINPSLEEGRSQSPNYQSLRKSGDQVRNGPPPFSNLTEKDFASEDSVEVISFPTRVKTEQKHQSRPNYSIKVRNVSVSSPKRQSKTNNHAGKVQAPNFMLPLAPQVVSTVELQAQHHQVSMQQIQQEMSEVKPLVNPQKWCGELAEKLRDKFWKTQYLGITTMRSLVVHHEECLEGILQETLEEILRGVLSLRSSISKNCLICLDEMLIRLKKKLEPYTENIVDCLLKKIVYANQFLQEEIRRCLRSVAKTLGDTKLGSILSYYKDNKSVNVKLGILLVVESLVKNQKQFKKEQESLWGILVAFADQCSLQVRDQAKRIIACLMQLYPDWRADVARLRRKSHNLDVDRILNLDKKLTLERESPSRTPPKGAQEANLFPPKHSGPLQNHNLEDLQRVCHNFKDWKHRTLAIRQLFRQVNKNPKEFCDSASCKRYTNILFDHLEDPNSKVVSNALCILEQILESMKPMIEERLSRILSSLLAAMGSARLEVYNKSREVYATLQRIIQQPKIVKELAKLLSHPNQKIKIKASRELSGLLPRQQLRPSLSDNIEKALNKVITEERNLQVQDSVKGLLQIIK